MRRFAASLILLLTLVVGCPPQPKMVEPKPKTEDGPKVIVDVTPPKGTDPLKTRIDAAIDHIRARDLRTDHGFWTIFHGILGMGLDTQLYDETTGKRTRAIDVIREGGPLRGMAFPRTPEGLDVQMGPTYVGQGHQDQFVAEMMQWGLPANTPWVVQGHKHTFEDFIKLSRARTSLKDKQELSWAIIVVGQHYGTDHAWSNENGEKIKFEDVVRYELDQPVNGAACGGTHRLFGLTWAYFLHRKRGGAKEGVWKEVALKLEDHKRNAKEKQNKDGSLSTNFFASSGADADNTKRINSTGHTFEWLALYLTEEEIRAPWVEDAANALCRAILENRDATVDGGSLYHAAHGLNLYRDRRFGTPIPIIPPPPKD